MEARFKSDRLKRLEVDVESEAGHQPGVVKAFRKRMQQIRAAVDERDFYNLKSLRFEKLKGDRQHQHSMRLNDQQRLILQIEGKGPDKVLMVIDIEDYH